MTVIAFREGLIAADSRAVTQDKQDEATVMFDHSPKLFRKFAGTKRECIIATAGDSDQGNRFVERYEECRRWRMHLDVGSAVLLVLDRRGLWEFEYQTMGELLYEPFYAIGTGRKAALGALWMGATAEAAVRAACNIDPYCGGKIHVWQLGDGQLKCEW